LAVAARVKKLREIGAWVIIGLGAIASGSCATNPATGQKEFSLVSESQEIAMGKEAADAVPREMGVYQDTAVQAYVSRIGMKLAGGSERPQLPWRFQVVDDPAVNAFALPGGFIFVTRGIMTDLESEAELATVMGHEVGHVTARHSAQQITREQLAQMGLAVGSMVSTTFANLAGAAQAGLQLLFLKYSRGNESQADELGYRYALKQNYDVRAMRGVFETLDGVTKAAGGARVPEWQSTHPAPPNRIQAVDARIAATQTDWSTKRVGQEEYLKLIDGMVYGDNPRQGFFQGSTFQHPNLKLQMTFPEGWKIQNQPGGVVAVSPQQDAVVQLTFGGASPEESAKSFFNGEGITPGQTRREQVNGLSAISGEFQAQADQTPVAGQATFLSYQNRTYALIGFTKTSSYQSYAPTIRASLTSFRALTDPKALAVQPNRIRVHQLNRSMTLAEFHRSYPSAIGLSELALVNRVDSTATLKAGQYVKQVVAGS
jgi:predicted Zn-dependent protease